MTRSVVETILGAVVLLVAVYFLIYGSKMANITPEGNYKIYADFAGIGGLKPGDDVQISGVKVGKVESVDLMPGSYLARVYMDLQSGIKLPTDTAALISSESLLGGRYLALEPGGDEETIPSGGRVQYTQAPQNLEQLLGQFIFSMKNEKDEKSSQQQQTAAPAQPATGNAQAVPETP